jgi:hypothetical protein
MWNKDTNVCEKMRASFFRAEEQMERKGEGNVMRKVGKEMGQ